MGADGGGDGKAPHAGGITATGVTSFSPGISRALIPLAARVTTRREECLLSLAMLRPFFSSAVAAPGSIIEEGTAEA